MQITAANNAALLDDDDLQPPKYLTFPVGSEVYGLNISFVREIIKMQPITLLPDVPEYVRGMINLRGRVIPVVDVRLRFKLPARAYDDRTCIIVVTADEWLVGLVVDTVSEVASIPDSDVEPAPHIVNGGGDHFLAGVGKAGGQVRLLLDVTRFLDQATRSAA